MSEFNDEHYLRAVTKLGDTRKIVADRDIYSQSGIKLVAAGVHVTSDLYEHLIKHKLLSMLDEALSVENMLDSKCILADVHDLFQANEKLQRMSEVIDKSFSEQKNSCHSIPAPARFQVDGSP